MATVIEGRTLPRRTRYGWQRYMDGRYWALKRGVDFEDLEKARAAAIMYASRHGIVLSTTKEDEDTLGIIVELQDVA